MKCIRTDYKFLFTKDRGKFLAYICGKRNNITMIIKEAIWFWSGEATSTIKSTCTSTFNSWLRAFLCIIFWHHNLNHKCVTFFLSQIALLKSTLREPFRIEKGLGVQFYSWTSSMLVIASKFFDIIPEFISE